MLVVAIATIGVALLGYDVALSLLRGRGPAVLSSIVFVALTRGRLDYADDESSPTR